MSSGSQSPTIGGIHHVTAIAGDPQPNLDFYVRFLGLRLVKKTVNFDDPGTYHLYYGDETGRPGTLLTFFPWPGARKGRHGTGQVTATSFAIPADSLPSWRERSKLQGIEASEGGERFGMPVLRLTDPDGLIIELVGSDAGSDDAVSADIPRDFAISGIDSASLAEEAHEQTADLLTGTLGFQFVAQDGNRFRYQAGPRASGGTIDLVCTPEAPHSLGGAGTVHHVAFRTPDDEQQGDWRHTLIRSGYNVSPVMDRQYFHSIYFREPGGILFEIATDPPGFAVDEAPEALGTTLRLPPQYEPMRAQIERVLPPITVPTTGLMTESY